jgi:DNA-binding CsgD family transcriptional regulator
MILTEKAKGVLNPQEVDVLRLMAVGFTNAEIADQLGFGVDSAKIKARNVFRKLGTDNRAAAVATGFLQKILTARDIKELGTELRPATFDPGSISDSV